MGSPLRLGAPLLDHIKGLAQYGFTADADRVATKFSETILDNFLRDGTIREKYNVVSGSANVAVATGYKSNVVGFGWTNGVYLQMNNLLGTGRRKDAPPPPSIATTIRRRLRTSSGSAGSVAITPEPPVAFPPALTFSGREGTVGSTGMRLAKYTLMG